MNIEILGKSFPMSMGLDAVKEITELLGCSLEQLGDTIFSAAMADQLVIYSKMAESMIKSAQRRERVKCKMFGEEYKEKIIPNAEEIQSCFLFGENAKLISAVVNTMKESQNGEVEIKDKKGKNGESHA